jgi:hypothetical protein
MTRRRELAAGLVLVLVAVVGWALVRTYPNYDSYFALDWGRELLDGRLPGYDAYAAPTPHPLWNLVAALTGLAGRFGERLIVLVAVVALAALVWGAARLAAACFGRGAGLLAGVLVGSSFGFLLDAAKGYVDVPFIALVAWAGALEQERPQRGWPVMALLALAGLLRPEAWLLALAYLAWLRRRPPLVIALALAGPVLWGAGDWIVTGDPLFSLHSTSATVAKLGRDVAARDVPRTLVSFLAATVRPPVLVLGVAGAVLAVRTRGWRATAVPLALLLGGVAVFVGNALVGLSAQSRYLTVPAMATCVFAAYALLGWRELAGRDPWRARWRLGAGAVVAASVVAGLVLLPGSVAKLTRELRFVRQVHDQELAVLTDPAVRPCRPIIFPTFRGVPDGRWLLDRPQGAVVAATEPHPPGGIHVFVGPQASTKAKIRYGNAAGIPQSTNQRQERFPFVARHGMWVARGGPCPNGT